MYPEKLQKIVDLFEMLPEEERRENLILYADQARSCVPAEGEVFDLEDVREDEGCTDTVGVFMKVGDEESVHLRATLGPQVQTLNRAMTTILCKGLEGSTIRTILDLPADFVPKIIGSQLVRVRSQTVYYVLTRIKCVCTAYIKRQRMANIAREQ